MSMSYSRDLLNKISNLKRKYNDCVFIYMLLDHKGKPFYIGSTSNPAFRYSSHYHGLVKNTVFLINTFRQLNYEPEMVLIDLTTTQDRLFLESYWINQYPDVINEERYKVKYDSFHNFTHESVILNTFNFDKPSDI